MKKAPDTLPSFRAAASLAFGHGLDDEGDASTIELTDAELSSITGGCSACGNPYHQPQQPPMPPLPMPPHGGMPGMSGMPGFGTGE